MNKKGNVLAVGLILIIAAIFMIALFPAIIESISSVESGVDSKAITLARLFPLGMILLLLFIFFMYVRGD